MNFLWVYVQKLKNLFSGRVSFVEVPFPRSIDIDTKNDLKIARIFLKSKDDLKGFILSLGYRNVKIIYSSFIEENLNRLIIICNGSRK